jgi:hypothetical protein
MLRRHKENAEDKKAVIRRFRRRTQILKFKSASAADRPSPLEGEGLGVMGHFGRHEMPDGRTPLREDVRELVCRAGRVNPPGPSARRSPETRTLQTRRKTVGWDK